MMVNKNARRPEDESGMGCASKKPSLWERYLTREIGIEFKACLYFFAILFYACMYRVCIGTFSMQILHMAEMILLTYLIGYAQGYLLWNFAEADKIRLREGGGLLLCTAVYAGASWLLGWFDRNLWVTLGFAGYVLILYLCVFLIYKTRRRIDDKILNEELGLFQARKS